MLEQALATVINELVSIRYACNKIWCIVTEEQKDAMFLAFQSAMRAIRYDENNLLKWNKNYPVSIRYACNKIWCIMTGHLMIEKFVSIRYACNKIWCWQAFPDALVDAQVSIRYACNKIWCLYRAQLYNPVTMVSIRYACNKIWCCCLIWWMRSKLLFQSAMRAIRYDVLKIVYDLVENQVSIRYACNKIWCAGNCRSVCFVILVSIRYACNKIWCLKTVIGMYMNLLFQSAMRAIRYDVAITVMVAGKNKKVSIRYACNKIWCLSEGQAPMHIIEVSIRYACNKIWWLFCLFSRWKSE